jgi:hypothetical protein
MNIIENLGIFAAGSASIAGIMIYFSKKIFENQISLLKDEQLQRFNKIYTEKLFVLKEIYRRLVIAEKSLEYLMRPVKFGSNKSENEIETETINSINALFDYFDENEIILNDQTATFISQLREKFYAAWGAHSKASFMEQARGTEVWSKSIDEKIKAYDIIVKKEIPSIKQMLKNDFQKQFKIFEIN